MTFSLLRSDGCGDSGNMSLAIKPNPDSNGGYIYLHNARPQIGYAMRVGSYSASTFSKQDWWQTTPITEIINEFKDSYGVETVEFKTTNSTYIWKSF